MSKVLNLKFRVAKKKDALVVLNPYVNHGYKFNINKNNPQRCEHGGKKHEKK